jgi:glycosyltransferase involved in cell wall biosynthesis
MAHLLHRASRFDRRLAAHLPPPVIMEAISVIIPTYNRAALVPRAIRSALGATREDDEIIVVDDGSVDDTAAAVAPFRDRVRYIRTENGGVGAARNRGVRLATRPLVTFLDSDDEYFPDKLELQRAFMAARPDVLFCFSDFQMFDDRTGERHSMYLRNWHGLDHSWDAMLAPGVPYSTFATLSANRDDFLVHIGNLYPSLIEGSLVSAWTSLIRRAEAGDALHFEEGIRICEDWWCFGRLARRGRAAFFACETAINHGHDGPRVTDTEQFDQLSCRLQMTERLWGADDAFRREHGHLYNRVIARIHHERAKWYLSRGWMREARTELRRAQAGMSLMLLLASLPGPIAALLGALRRLAMRALMRSIIALPLALCDFSFDMVAAAALG